MYWDWVKENFLPAVYNVTWYNNHPFHGPEGFTGSKSVFLVGMPRIRQIRVKPGMFFVMLYCFLVYLCRTFVRGDLTYL